MHKLLPWLLRHEVEHSITPRRPGDPSGPEEATAELLSMAAPAQAELASAMPPFEQYGRTDPASAAVVEDWKLLPAANSGKAQRLADQYAGRRDAIDRIAKLAGIDVDTSFGYAKGRDVLQSSSVHAAGTLAGEFQERLGLGPDERYELVRALVGLFNKPPKDVERRVAEISARFGLGSATER